MIGGRACAGAARAGAKRVAPVCPARRAARTGSRSARGRRATERVSFRMQTPRFLAPDAAGRSERPQVSVFAVRGWERRLWAYMRLCCERLEAGLISEQKAGGGIHMEFSLAFPSYCVLP